MSGDDGDTGARKLGPEAVDRMKNAILHDVGYKKPPTQFQKGRSGNPRGRPRGVAADLSLSDEPLLQAILEAMDKTVSVKEGGKVKEIPMVEAVVQSGLKEVFKGNARYFGIISDMHRTATQARAHEIRRSNELWSRVKERHAELLADAAAQGKPAPLLLPHPDDIVIDHISGPRFLGPAEEGEQARMEETIRVRDVLIMQDVLDQRSATRLDGAPLKEPGGALVLALLLERAIPPRLRLSNLETIIKQELYERLTKRQLLKAVYKAWADLRRPKPRGYVFPDRSTVVKKVELVVAFANAAWSGEIDVDAVARGEFDDEFLAFLERNGGQGQ